MLFFRIHIRILLKSFESDRIRIHKTCYNKDRRGKRRVKGRDGGSNKGIRDRKRREKVPYPLHKCRGKIQSIGEKRQRMKEKREEREQSREYIH
jgi:hypothetical protein